METKEKNISLYMLYQAFRRHVWWIAAALIIGVLAGVFYTKCIATPKYSSTAVFMVDSTSDSPSIIGTTYQMGMESKAANIVVILKGNVFLQSVADEYNATYGTNFSVEQIASRVKADTVSGTASFKIKITSQDPKEAYQLLQIFEKMTPGYLSYLRDPQQDGSDVAVKAPYTVSLVDEGRQANSPESPNLLRNVVFFGMGMTLATYLVFMLITLFDNTIYDADNLRNQFKVPVLGEIPEWRQSGKSEKDVAKERRAIRRELKGKKASDAARNYNGRLLNEQSPFAVTESFRTLRTNLIYSASGEGTPVFGVVSALPGAGKSVVAANSAVSFSKLNKKVLLIDGDMRCPVQAKIFGVTQTHKGLSEYLAGISDSTLADSVVHTDFEGLDLLTCGRIPPNPGELLSSDRMTRLLEEAKEKYDYVFIDLPPIYETSDAGVLAKHTTGYLMVVRSSYSNFRSVGGSVEAMEAVHGRIVGFILNDVAVRTGGYGAYDGSYYKYSRYGSERYRRGNVQDPAEKPGKNQHHTE